ncbi:MAG: hypothetical protein LUH05_04075 [Candidatus Gastranaerophilales bacterium]|nr:hypothetical protein [Candidatus Gastranaerophilales bacterium]
MRKFLISVLFLFLFCPSVFADDYLIPAPVVYTEFTVKDDYILIAGLWKDLNNYNLRLTADEIECNKNICESKQALISFTYGTYGVLMPSGDTYKIIKRDDNNILLKSDCENFEGYINIDIKNKTAYKTKVYSHSPEIDKYQLLTDIFDVNEETRRIIQYRKNKE